MVLSAAYFPPIEYFACLAKYSVVLDSSEQYQKQSYRNRCRILTSNGVEDLRVPIVHNGQYGIRDVKVDYSVDWVRRTEYAIESAYSSSPFFEYYRDSLFALLDAKPSTLWELDLNLTRYFCDKTGIDFGKVDTDSVPEGERYQIHPKMVSAYRGREYWQVFRHKFGFVPNLSVMDLLFNEGPESICYL